MTNVFKFLLGVDSIEGTILEQRIDKFAVKDAKTSESYQRKYLGYDFNRNKHLFNEEQITKIQNGIKEFIFFCGYTDQPGQAD